MGACWGADVVPQSALGGSAILFMEKHWDPRGVARSSSQGEEGLLLTEAGSRDGNQKD